jgi:flagellar basal-body rod protein FlgC
MDTISNNIANANTVAGSKNDAYHRRSVALSATPNGVRIEKILEDSGGIFNKKHDPDNPLHDGEGNVWTSNVDPTMEMVDMISASRAYEANIAAFNTVKGMIGSALQIGKA